MALLVGCRDPGTQGVFGGLRLRGLIEVAVVYLVCSGLSALGGHVCRGGAIYNYQTKGATG